MICTAGTLCPSSKTMVLSRLTFLVVVILIGHFNPGTLAQDSANGEEYRHLVISYFMIINRKNKRWTFIPESYAGDWNILSTSLLRKEREGSRVRNGKIRHTAILFVGDILQYSNMILPLIVHALRAELAVTFIVVKVGLKMAYEVDVRCNRRGGLY